MPVMEAESPLAKNIAAGAKGTGKSIKDYMKGRRDVYMVNPFDIEIEDGFNARDVTSPKVVEHIDNLAISIKEIGLQRPLKVRMKKGRPILIDGECRLRATIRAIEVYDAEIVAVPVTTTDKTMSDAEATLALVVENSGLDLNALEKSLVFKRLASYGWSTNDIAARAGLSSVRVIQMLELAAVPESLKEMIRRDEIAPTLAWSLAKDNDFDEKTTMQCVKAALKQARNAGRNKVTARHVGGSRVSFKASVLNIFAGGMIEDVGEDGIVIAFTREEAEQLAQLKVISLAS